MKSTVLARLRGHKKKKKQESARSFNLNDAKLEDHYSLSDELGKGASTGVKRGAHLKTKKGVAIRGIDKNSIDGNVASLKTEVQLLMNVKHPNIVNLLDVFEDDNNLYLIMELMTGGALIDTIYEKYSNGYSEQHASRLSRQIIEAVRYLHQKGIIHRDLKPENLLFATTADDSPIKISSFGLAKIYCGDTLARTACGSPGYYAPEVLLKENLTQKLDMWSVGVIVYLMLCGFLPFVDENLPTLFRIIVDGDYSFPAPYWSGISDGAKDFITNLLVVNPAERMTPDQALAHRWIRDNHYQEPAADATHDLLSPVMAAPKKKNAPSFLLPDKLVVGDDDAAAHF